MPLAPALNSDGYLADVPLHPDLYPATPTPRQELLARAFKPKSSLTLPDSPVAETAVDLPALLQDDYLANSGSTPTRTPNRTNKVDSGRKRARPADAGHEVRHPAPRRVEQDFVLS